MTSTQQRASTTNSSSTIAVDASTATETRHAPVVRLKLKKPKCKKKVEWSEGTIDNEHMNKKKSKSCCIYHKPREFGESSSSEDSDDEEELAKHQHKNPINDQESESTPTVEDTSISVVNESEIIAAEICSILFLPLPMIPSDPFNQPGPSSSSDY